MAPTRYCFMCHKPEWLGTTELTFNKVLNLINLSYVGVFFMINLPLKNINLSYFPPVAENKRSNKTCKMFFFPFK